VHATEIYVLETLPHLEILDLSRIQVNSHAIKKCLQRQTFFFSGAAGLLSFGCIPPATRISPRRFIAIAAALSALLPAVAATLVAGAVETPLMRSMAVCTVVAH
jgi:hypothetical protein